MSPFGVVLFHFSCRRNRREKKRDRAKRLALNYRRATSSSNNNSRHTRLFFLLIARREREPRVQIISLTWTYRETQDEDFFFSLLLDVSTSFWTVKGGLLTERGKKILLDKHEMCCRPSSYFFIFLLSANDRH